MKDVVIVSTARTPIGVAFKGSLNNIKSPTMTAHAIRHAVERAGVDGGEIDDVVIGTVLAAGTAGMNVARLAGLAAGLPVTVAGQTIDRQCSSGLMAIATAARQIMVEGMDIVVAGGQDNISAVQNRYYPWVGEEVDPNVVSHAEHAYMPMLLTAEHVVNTYGIAREVQDEYALQSQLRTAAAQQAGVFDEEIVPLHATRAIKDKETGEISYRDETLSQDEGNRPQTTLAGLAGLNPVIEGGSVTAGNASQLSDGASACVLMDLPGHRGRR
jgi:acetyl-CoA acetyltransferase family protein